MSHATLAFLIDHTLLRPDATAKDIDRLCGEARDYGFGAAFVPPCFLSQAVRALAGSGVRVGVPVGFPFGYQTTRAKVQEAVDARSQGADELDVVLNVSWVKSGAWREVGDELAGVVAATPGAGHKVILEVGFLTREEILTVCRTAVEARMEYVKTASGFGPRGATVDDVRLMKEAVAGLAKVKASGGIRDARAALALLEAGADRLGTSAGVAIVEEWTRDPDLQHVGRAVLDTRLRL
ncbi:MAG: deoxyribose-phosphate aldolase [Nitrospirales bacterium]